MDQENIKIGLLGALGGAIVLAIMGFALGGWITGGTGQEMTENAIVARLAPICVEQFKQDPEKDRKLKDLKKGNAWEAGGNVAKQGWATMPGTKKPDSEVAEKCAEMIVQLGQ